MSGVYLMHLMTEDVPADLPGLTVPLSGGAADGLLVPSVPFAEAHDAISAHTGVLSSHFLLTRAVLRSEPVALPACFVAIMPLWGAEEAVAAALLEEPGVRCVVRCAGMYRLWALIEGAVPRLAGVRRMVVAPLQAPVDGLSLRVAPEDLDGPKLYRLSHRKEKALAAGDWRHFTAEMIADYARQSAALAERLVAIEVEQGAVSVVFAPARGAVPMVDAMLEGYRRLRPDRAPWEPLVVLPPTSSFLSGVHGQGHNGIRLSLRRLLRRGLLPARMLYIDEIISGGMYRRHTKDLAAFRSAHDIAAQTPVHGFALADRGGARFRAPQQFAEEARASGRLVSFDALPVIELLTEDRRQLLGVHYADYTQGLHTVPYVEEDGADDPLFVEMWDGFRAALSGA